MDGPPLVLSRGDAQLVFPRLLGKLLVYADESGTAVKMGECQRTPEQAQINARKGTGIADSLHLDRLAVDLLCFRQVRGIWTWLRAGTEPEYRMLGDAWKKLHPNCAWGGDWTHPDPGHFSLRIDARA